MVVSTETAAALRAVLGVFWEPVFLKAQPVISHLFEMLAFLSPDRTGPLTASPPSRGGALALCCRSALRWPRIWGSLIASSISTILRLLFPLRHGSSFSLEQTLQLLSRDCSQVSTFDGIGSSHTILSSDDRVSD